MAKCRAICGPRFITKVTTSAIGRFHLFTTRVTRRSAKDVDVKWNGTRVAIVGVRPIFRHRMINIFVSRLHSVGRRPLVQIDARRFRIMLRYGVTIKDTYTVLHHFFWFSSGHFLCVSEGSPPHARLQRAWPVLVKRFRFLQWFTWSFIRVNCVTRRLILCFKCGNGWECFVRNDFVRRVASFSIGVVYFIRVCLSFVQVGTRE